MRKRFGKPGMSPGLEAVRDEKPTTEFTVLVVSYDKNQLTETEMPLADVPAPDPSDGRVTWLRFPSMPDSATLAHFGSRWGLNPLDLEDVVNVGQRSKSEVRDKSAFTILHLPRLDSDDELQLRQVSLFLGPNYVISIREDGPAVFDAVLTRPLV